LLLNGKMPLLTSNSDRVSGGAVRACRRGAATSAGMDASIEDCSGVGSKMDASVRTGTEFDSRFARASKAAKKKVLFGANDPPRFAPHCCRLDGGFTRVETPLMKDRAKGSPASRL